MDTNNMDNNEFKIYIITIINKNNLAHYENKTHKLLLNDKKKSYIIIKCK